jgi:hypothetical protein
VALGVGVAVRVGVSVGVGVVLGVDVDVLLDVTDGVGVTEGSLDGGGEIAKTVVAFVVGVPVSARRVGASAVLALWTSCAIIA